MPLAQTINSLTTRFERTQNCPRSPWLWAGPTVFCLLVGVALGVSQQNDPRWPARQYLTNTNPRDGSYTISLVYDKAEKRSATQEVAPTIEDLTNKDGFRMFSVPRSAKDIPLVFKPFLEQHPTGTVMLVQDRNGNVVDAQTVHDVKEAIQVIASLRK